MTAETLTLTDFLRARLVEDIEIAEHVIAYLKTIPHQPGSIGVEGRDVYDLRRVPREIEAKRQIVELHEEATRVVTIGRPEREQVGCEVCSGGWTDADWDGPGTVPWPCPTLRALASVYASHPDWREEWAL